MVAEITPIENQPANPVKLQWGRDHLVAEMPGGVTSFVNVACRAICERLVLDGAVCIGSPLLCRA